MIKKIFIFTGGTGGHVIPAVIFGNFLISKGIDCYLFIDKRGSKYINNFEGKIFITKSSHFGGSLQFKLKSFVNLVFGLLKSLYLIYSHKPQECISFGSYATFTPMLSSVLINKIFNRKILLYIHEQNTVVGKVNLLFIKYVKYIFTNFDVINNLEKKFLLKKITSGNPKNFGNKIRIDKEKKNKNQKTLFVYGGSQGSKDVINAVISLLPKINKNIRKKIKIYFQCPLSLQKNLINSLKFLKLDYEVKSFYYNIDEILSLTHVAITRAGAGTISDIVYYKIPSIIFPLPNSIYNHQYYNAKFLLDKKAAFIFNENKLNIEKDIKLLENLFLDDNNYLLMKKNLENIPILDANKIIFKNMSNEE